MRSSGIRACARSASLAVPRPETRSHAPPGSRSSRSSWARAGGKTRRAGGGGGAPGGAPPPDADIELAASAVALGGYANAGQVCISVQRVLAARALGGALLAALRPHARA